MVTGSLKESGHNQSPESPPLGEPASTISTVTLATTVHFLFICTCADVDDVHFNHRGQLIEAVGMKGNRTVLGLLQGGTVLSWDLKGPTVAVHECEGDAGDTLKEQGGKRFEKKICPQNIGN